MANDSDKKRNEEKVDSLIAQWKRAKEWEREQSPAPKADESQDRSNRNERWQGGQSSHYDSTDWMRYR